MTAGAPTPRRAGMTVPASGTGHVYSQIMAVLRGEVEPLVPAPLPVPQERLRIAFAVPHFARGSGGHQVIFRLGHALEEQGHAVSYWLHDPFEERPEAGAAAVRALIRAEYAPIRGPVFAGFADWPGADVAIATGWQTVYPLLALPGTRARAYLLNDHEPEFYPTSVESRFAARTYTLGLPCISGGGPWLARLVTERYGARVVADFPYPVAPELRPRPVARREDTIVVYARNVTPRRGVAFALMGLEELVRRRPHLRVVLFGDEGAPELTFAYEHLGTATPEELSWVYSEATVGIAISLTHGSLVPHDMLACGLPPVDLDGGSMAAEHADTDLVELVPPDPVAMADRIEALLDDPGRRARRGAEGMAYVRAHTWAGSAERVAAGLRLALAERADAPRAAAR